ncbi:MAG: hypothetical protein MUE73_13030 [Planctomycetes bacterium]|jgi:hypothetical protein|nr:hypothetical protein [Planctomycetota bacterium]
MKLSGAARLLVGANFLTGVAVVALLAVGTISRVAPPPVSPSTSGSRSVGGLPEAATPAQPRPPDLPPPEPLPEPGRGAAPDRAEAANRTRRLVSEVALACELSMSTHEEFPPSGAGDDVNEGAESLLAALFTGGYLGRVVRDAPRGDTDGDGKSEILDFFGNPLVYFRNDRYDVPGRYRISGRDIVAVPQLSVRTGEYHARDFVMVWSAGPDGENENGRGDDITSWHIRD